VANPMFAALFAPLGRRSDPWLIRPDLPAITGAGFLAEIETLAAVLGALGLRPGDRLAAQVQKSPRALALYGAAVRQGLVFLPMNPAYTADEVAYVLTDAEPALFVCDPKDAASLSPRAAEIGATVLTLGADGEGSLWDAARDAPAPGPAADRNPDDLAAILYTSGTTGRPKGAMLTQANLLSNAEALVDIWRFGPGDVLLHALPIFHTHGLFVATHVLLLARGAMIFLPAFDPGAVFAALPQATAMMGVPTFYTRLLSDPRLTRDSLAHLRVLISGSAPLLPETHRAFEARTGHAILERYGMTEANMITSNPYDGPRLPGRVGRPLPGVELRLADPDADGVGGIEVKGPGVSPGYWRNPEKTAEEFGADGWFRTGDLGRIDADGLLAIVGRAKDLVISGGLNIYPKEVEDALDRVKGVRESAVIGLPHPDFGEAVFAVLTAEAGVTIDAAAVLAAIAPRLARFKQPKAAVVVDDLPRNAMGKVQKAALRQTYAGWFASVSSAS
jgi:malonyl-CoA/methylmalonyl-CoA synthetase